MEKVFAISIAADTIQGATDMYNKISRLEYKLVSVIPEAGSYSFMVAYTTPKVSLNTLVGLDMIKLDDLKVRLVSLVIKAQKTGYLVGKWCPKYNVTKESLAYPTFPLLREDPEFFEIIKLSRYFRSQGVRIPRTELVSIANDLGYNVVSGSGRSKSFRIYSTKYQRISFVKKDKTEE